MDVRKLLWVLNVALLVALGYVLDDVVSGYLSAKTENAPSDEQSVRSEGTASLDGPQPVRSEDVALILRRNIFARGQASAAAQTPEESQPLRLRVLGVVAGDESISRAVIEDLSQRTTGVYRTGDSVGGARIRQIAHDGVVFVRGGRTSTLEVHANPTDLPDANDDVGSPSGTPVRSADRRGRSRTQVRAF